MKGMDRVQLGETLIDVVLVFRLLDSWDSLLVLDRGLPGIARMQGVGRSFSGAPVLGDGSSDGC